MHHISSLNAKEFSVSFTKQLIELKNFVETLILDAGFYNFVETDGPTKTKAIDRAETITTPLFRIEDIKFPTFYFFIRLVKTGTSVHFSCQINPSPTGAIKSQASTAEEVKRNFLSWFEKVEEYNELNRQLKSDYTDQYYNQYYNNYKLYDEDYEEAPFSAEKQEQVFNFLEQLKRGVETIEPEQAPEKEKLLLFIEETQTKIGVSTKKQVVQALAKITATIQKWGPKAFKYLGQKFIEAGIKIAAEKTLPWIAGQITNIFNPS